MCSREENEYGRCLAMYPHGFDDLGLNVILQNRTEKFTKIFVPLQNWRGKNGRGLSRITELSRNDER